MVASPLYLSFVVALLSSISMSSFIALHPRIYAAASSTSNGFNDFSVTVLD
jgi:hypothetical protein